MSPGEGLAASAHTYKPRLMLGRCTHPAPVPCNTRAALSWKAITVCRDRDQSCPAVLITEMSPDTRTIFNSKSCVCRCANLRALSICREVVKSDYYGKYAGRVTWCELT